MKRPRGEGSSGSKQKRAIGNSSRGETSGEAPVASTTSSAQQRPTTDDALAYLMTVKETFWDRREKYDEFLTLMQDFKNQRIDTGSCLVRMKELFKEHPNLVLGFNTFLPRGYEVVLPPMEKRPVEFNEAITYVNKIKMRFENTEYVYNEFLGILNKYRTEKKSIPDVFKDISTLFQHHQDLVEEFAQFIPDASLETAPQHGGTSVRRDEMAVPSMQQSHAVKREKLRISRDRDLNIDRPEMEHGKQRRRMEKEKDRKEDKGRRDHELDEKDTEQDGRDSENEQSKQTPPGRTDESMTEQLHQGEKDTENCATNDVPASFNVETNILKSMYTQELKFFEKVKEKLHVDTYKEFLKCLDLYSKEIIIRSELVNLVSDILEKYPDLMDGFNGFLGHCGNIDGFLTGVINKKSSWNGGDTTRPSNTYDRDRDRVRDRDRDQEKDKDKEKERYRERVKEREKPDKGATSGSKDTALQKTSSFNKKEKYSLSKPISELDLSNCQRCTPSYRLLPANYQVPSSSHRTKIGALVLNDSWVSVTSGSEDYSFKHMRKNQYEEILFRCEDDRFELDMLLESINATTKRVEELLEKVQDNIIELDSPIRFEDHFIPLHLRCIERIYGDHGLDVMDVLRTNASLALPVILTRLKQKQDEWSRCHADFNKVWAEIYAKNYHKSLDHRSFYFKQQDTKKLSTKALLADIKEIYEKRQKEDDVLLANAAGIRQPIVSDMEYEYTDSNIHEDLYTIIRHACEEVCASTDLDKVMRVWTAFLEPILGVLPRPHGAEDTGDVVRTNKIASKSTFVSLEGMDGHPGSNGTTAYEQLNRGIDGGDSITPEQASPCRSRVADGYTSIAENGLHAVDQTSHDRGLLCNPTLHENALGDETDISCLASRLEQSHIRTNLDVLSGVSTTTSKFIHTGIETIANSLLINQVLPSTEGVVNSEPILLINIDCSAESNQGKGHYENSNAYNTEKVYREDAELSPDGDFEEDNSVVYGNAVGDVVPHVKNSFTGRQYQVRPVEVTYCSEAAGDNDADVDDEGGESPQKSFGDSEDVYEVGEDALGSESDGEEYSHEDHEEEEEEENGDPDVKAASAGEAEGMADARDLEGKGSLASSERFLHTVKPLSRHVPEALHEDKSSRIFYGNDSFYILFRLHQTLYERILTAKTNSAIAERNWRTEKDTNPPDLYAKFMSALFNLLDGSADNTKFEHDCRATIGTQSYVLFTLDKLIYKVVKQLETVASDEMGDKLLQLYTYEKSRQTERFMDVLYHENARVLLHDQSIYRFESSSNPTWFSIQLMNYRREKTEVTAAPMEPNFAAYLYNDFFSSVPNRKNRNFIFLRRNKRRYASNDEHSATCMAMEGIRVVNGLESKISCNSSKISYVLDTEDILYRIGKRKRNSYKDTTACHDGAHNSNAYAVKVQRFHQYLSRFLT